jgi:hypothetical protein
LKLKLHQQQLSFNLKRHALNLVNLELNSKDLSSKVFIQIYNLKLGRILKDE